MMNLTLIDLTQTTPKDKYGRPILENSFNEYGSSHTWYYHLSGPIIRPEYIKPNEALTFCNFKLPKELFEIERLRDSIETELAADIEKYKMYASKFYNPGDLNLCTSLALKHNHISYNKGILMHLDSKCPKQASFFLKGV